MSTPNVGPSIPDWSNNALDPAGTDNSVGGTQAPANATGPQNAASVDTGPANPALAAPKKAEASLDASAMKANVNAIPINQAAPQKHDYAAEAKARWEASTSPKQKWETANNPMPPLKPFVGDHEKAVEEAAGVFDKLPGAELGHHIAEFIAGTDASGNKIDRSEKSRQISRDILKEGVSHVTGEAVGEVYGEAIGAVGGKAAGIVGKKVVGEVAGTAAGEVAGEAARKIAGDPKD